MILQRKTRNAKAAVFLAFTMLLLTGKSDAQDKPIWLNQARFGLRANMYVDAINPATNGIYMGDFPNGTHELTTIPRSKAGLMIGHMTGKGPESIEHGPYGSGAQDGPNYMVGKYGNIKNGYSDELPLGVWEIKRYLDPVVMVDGENAFRYGVASEGVFQVINQEIKADKMAHMKHKQKPGMSIDTKAYQMVNHLYGDFVIIERTFKLIFNDMDNASFEPDSLWDATQTFENFYYIQSYSFRPGWQAGVPLTTDWFMNKAGSWQSHMLVPSIVPGSVRKDLFVSYGWDADYEYDRGFLPNGGPFGRTFDDFGDPRWTPFPDGNLLTTAYKGHVLLQIDKSPTDKSDWIEQPHSFRLIDHKIQPTDDEAWELFALTKGTYDQSAIETSPSTANSLDLIPGGFMVMGPWDLQLGDSVRVVWAIGAGSITRHEARAVGAAWAQWFEFGDVPEAYYKGELVTDEVKNRYVALGKDSLTVTMQRAHELWSNNLECPHPYPAPDLTVSSANRSCLLEWSDVAQQYTNPNGGSDDVIAYRIYRKLGNVLDDYKDEAGLVDLSGKPLAWYMIKEIPVEALEKNENGLYFYNDPATIGEDYHYAVTAISSQQCGIDGSGPRLESSQWLNRTVVAASPYDEGLATIDDVVVVPNPYYILGTNMNVLSDQNRLMIMNLPHQCHIRVYNITGDLVLEREHTTGSSISLWDQITDNNQFIASGIYILVITDASTEVEDDSGNITLKDIPGKKFVKFSVIR